MPVKMLRGQPDGIDPEITENCAANDSNWFAVRPGRAYRARPWVEGEAPRWNWGKGQPYVLVRQLKPGIRLRLFLGWHGVPLESASEDELAALWAKWELPDHAELRRKLTQW